MSAQATTTTQTPAVTPPAPVVTPPAAAIVSPAAATTSTTAALATTTPAVDPAKATTTQPEIEIALPKGVEADAELLDGFRAFAKENGLTSAKAQSLVDTFVKSQEAGRAKAVASWEAEQKAWETQAKSDKEYGGAAFDASLVVANKAIAKLGSPDLVKLLKESGLGNHPEMVRFAYRAGKAIAEDSVAGSSAGTGTTMTEEQKLRLAYPTMFPKE